ncbi:MAG TPA: hypothetical protein VEL11_07625 [Candidatus Bathyarchaeia archaeon]|nr:hypothetical protein [Candidatus Bathyarchaeia archaeon]
MTEERQFDETKGKKCDPILAIAVVGVVLFATISVTILSIQITHAENTTAINNATNNSINFKLGNKTYTIKYHIVGGKLTGISAEKDNISLLLNVSSTSDGKLRIELPRNIIDSKKQENVDDNFAVFVDGQYAAADEIRTTAQARTLMVDFDNGTSVIEITGTQLLPEFSTVVVAIFALSIIGVILATSRYNGITSKMHL